MIVVQLIGGLGNQMFQYALGRSIANKRRTNLGLDISWFDNIDNLNTRRQYELDCYPITAKITDARKLKIKSGSDGKKSAGIGRFFRHTEFSIFTEPSPSFHKKALEQPDNTYLIGYWQNQKYFSDIRSQLLVEFTPKQLSNYTQNMAKKINKAPSVSLHVRRGDYANDPKTNKFHGLAPIEYYIKALEQITKKAGKQQLFVFSDDIGWCQQNLPFSKQATFVDGNPPKRSYEDMYLMRLCSNNVIANSSFSWWGAWLNENPDKIIAVPKNWFQDQAANRKATIVPEQWLKL